MKIACVLLTMGKDVGDYNFYELLNMSKKSKYKVDLFEYNNYDYTNIKKQLNYNHDFMGYRGLNFLTVLDCYLKNPSYDYYLFFEEDLIYNSLENLFDKIFDSFTGFDVVFQDKRIIDYKWYWYSKRLNNLNYPPYSGLLNIYVLKSNVIKDLLDFIKEGYWAHHEYLINSFVLENNYKVGYLEDIFKIKCDWKKLNCKCCNYDLIHPIKSLKEYYTKVKKLCIQTLVKDEHEYIKEWVDYHLNLGFNDIFIFEDKGSKSHKEIFNGYDNVHIQSVEEIREVTSPNTCKGLLQLIKYFFRKLKKENTYGWCLFSDVDEFLVLDGIDLRDLCVEYLNYPGILLSWKLYNSNGHIKKLEGNVVDNYTSTIEYNLNEKNMYNKKSFVNIEKALGFKNNHIVWGGADMNKNQDFNAPKIYEKAWINHYFSKSWEEYVTRMKRGNLGNNTRNFDVFFQVNPDLKLFEEKLLNSIKQDTDILYISNKEIKFLNESNYKKI